MRRTKRRETKHGLAVVALIGPKFDKIEYVLLVAELIGRGDAAHPDNSLLVSELTGMMIEKGIVEFQPMQ